jgi:hypothetical protein
MLEKIKLLLQEKWTWIIGLIVTLAGLFVLERSRRKDSDAKLEVAETNKEAAVIDTKRDAVAEEVKAVDQEVAKVMSDAEAKKAAAESEDLHDIEAYYNKKKPS